MLAILLLAAGRSSRMNGKDKLLEPVNDTPLLRMMALRAQINNVPVFAVLPPDRPEREKALTGLDVQTVVAQNAHEGMAHSLIAGIAALPSAIDAAMILPADMPEITADDIATMVAAHKNAASNSILRATAHDATPGHPVIFPRAYFDELSLLSGDEGARSVLANHKTRITFVPLPDHHALTDLDTPDEWAEWRARQHQGSLR
ncbi:CTP:molybdopterin cytidylyltransferase MocA [Shimia isoporae]|uniref:CTP:molybdopterin cytidylyltransferase MocA n=1 Tax=Shimia isoporae TaxID=647720 RepID=A0A4R1NP46_9RHOB|nr:nucleotidyltransferase family protein [Shimia isoporae]TCL09611.1 CTP:molybdopterin cytidylyltransferase MocA [Shimia isoporae]